MVLLGSSSIFLQGVLDQVLETIAIREGQCLANDLYKHNVIISNDCKTVISKVKGAHGGENSTRIKEIIVCSSNFTKYSFIYESRQSNFDSHNLARFSLSLDRGRHVCLINPHDLDCIDLFVESDQ